MLEFKVQAWGFTLPEEKIIMYILKKKKLKFFHYF
jgi:hypothetical protein